MNVAKFCRKPLVASLMVSFVLLLITAGLVYQRFQLYKDTIRTPDGDWKIFFRSDKLPVYNFSLPFFLLGIAFSITGGFLTWYLTRQIEEEKRIHKAVITAQENERMQIGMELHDNVNQILAVSGLYLAMLKEKLDDKKMATEILDRLKTFNEEVIDELRRLSHQLAPSIDAGSTLVDKINTLIQNMKLDEKLKISVRIDKFTKSMDDKLQLNFYRMLQEQLSNIMKYAEARSIEISIQSRPKSILLQIRDNGKGFDTHSKRAGIGLENIRRRAELMNGKVKIISSPGNGCEVNVEIPVLN